MIEARLRTQISEDELAEKAGKIVTPHRPKARYTERHRSHTGSRTKARGRRMNSNPPKARTIGRDYGARLKRRPYEVTLADELRYNVLVFADRMGAVQEAVERCAALILKGAK